MTLKTFPESFRRKFKIWRRFVTSRLVPIRAAGENENTVWVIGGATKVVKRVSFFCQKEQKLFIIFVKIIVSWRQTNLKKVVLLPSVGLGTFPGLGFRVSTFFPLILLSILGWTSPRRCCFDGEAFSSSEQKTTFALKQQQQHLKISVSSIFLTREWSETYNVKMYNSVKYSRLSKSEDENFKMDNTTDTFNFTSPFSYEPTKNKYARW